MKILSAQKAVDYIEDLGYPLVTGKELGIVYIEGASPDGTVNDDRIDRWNDLRGLITYESGKWVWRLLEPATSEPGHRATVSPEAKKRGGVFRIAMGYHDECWVHGFHKNPWHPCLKQAPDAKIWGYRDPDCRFIRYGPKVQGYGINQHGASRVSSPSTVGSYSEGCLVGQNWDRHLLFCALLKTDPRYLRFGDSFRYSTTVLAGDLMQKAVGALHE